MTVTCLNCRETYPYDPALGVPCRMCQAPAGMKCRRPSGHDCELHIARDALALKQGKVRPCPASKGNKGQRVPKSDQLTMGLGI